MQVWHGDLNLWSILLNSSGPGAYFSKAIFFLVIKGAVDIRGGQVRDFLTMKQFNSWVRPS